MEITDRKKLFTMAMFKKNKIQQVCIYMHKNFKKG
jgi:hypothetical protein